MNRSDRATTFLSTLVLAATLACDEDCESLSDCDSDECIIIRGHNLDGADPEGLTPAGCTHEDVPAGDLVTEARAPDGSCWVFPTRLIPDDFSPDLSCRR